MTDFIEFSGKLLLVFAASFALCWLSACNAIKEQTEEDWKSLTAEERANDRIRNYVASKLAKYAGEGWSRGYAIANRTALMFASCATVIWFVAYAVWTYR